LLAESTEPGLAPTVSARGLGIACNYAPGLCENEPGHVCRDKWECTTLACKPGSGASAASGLGIGLQLAGTGTVPATVDLGLGGNDPGRNAITLNANANANPTGANLKSSLVLASPLKAAANQWEHCDTPLLDANPTRCNVAQVLNLDVVLDPGATGPDLGTPTGPRHGPAPTVTEVSPGRPRAG